MDLKLQNEVQFKIADLLWTATDMEKVNYILKVFGKDAEIVYNMMVAEVYDKETDTDLAQEALQNIMRK
jgi:hypothetical protein